MAEVIRMPKMSDTMEEGVIASWLKKEGDEVNSGDILAEVETDKATMELESYQDGVLLYIGVKEKDTVPVDGVLAVIGEKGEEFRHLLAENGSKESSSETQKVVEQTSSSGGEVPDVSGVNASIIRMPKMSDTMEEGVIASWLKKVGDKVESGDVLAEVETDKATMELEAYEDGILLYVGVEAGSAVAVDGVIAIVGEDGADYNQLLKADAVGSVSSDAPVEAEEKSASEPYIPATASVETSNNGRIFASPLAKKIAQEKGIDITQVSGSGDGGRIIKRDIENFTPQIQQASSATISDVSATASVPVELPTIVAEEKSNRIEISQMRKSIAKRLGGSKFTAPHFYLTMEINMDKALEARKSMNEISPVKISFNDIIIKAVATSIRKHPDVNVSWAEDHIVKHEHIHIGVAVAIPDGLIVPVVRFADNKTISHISAEIKDLGAKAKGKKLKPEEFVGSTFSVSNLGMFGIEEFTAIINPPESCILAVGGIKETVKVENGKIKPTNVMKVTMSCDHRAVDGAVGAAFLKTFKEILEHPIRILV